MPADPPLPSPDPLASVRRPLIGVMGAGDGADPAALELAQALGTAIARQGWGLLSGGRPCGVMAAVSRGAMAVDGHLVVGVLPGDGTDGAGAPEATAALDVALFTGLGQARNVINVLSSTVLVVCGAGGPGTLSEAAHALRAGRPLLLLAVPPTWRQLFAGLGGDVRSCETVEAAIAAIGRWLAAGGTGGEPPAAPARLPAPPATVPTATVPTASVPTAPAGTFHVGTVPAATVLAATAPPATPRPVPVAAAPAAAAAMAPAANAALIGAAGASGEAEARGAAAAAPADPDAPRTMLPVALVQLRAGEEVGANRRHAEAWLERALQPPPGQPAPRLLMLPEIWNAPYAAARFAAYAEPIPEPGASLLDGPSPSLAMVARLARRHGVSVIAGSIPERGADGRIYNTATVVDGAGVLRARHRKLHLFDVDVPGGIRFRESDSLTGGQGLTVLPPDGDPLGTGLVAPPGLGLLICYDIRFPELALLMQQQQGCTLLACPAAFNTTTGPRHWHLLMRARAVDTQCFVLACSSARPDDGDAYPSYGHSLVVDPWGAVLAEAGIGEQVLHATIDLSQVALARQAIPTARQRRGDLYRLSTV